MQPPADRVTLALAGDTMLGRKVAERLSAVPAPALFADELVEVLRDADLVVCNLECCVSARGERWPDPHKPFFFRAPPRAAEVLADLGVDAVTLANNHSLDYGPQALGDSVEHLRAAGIVCVGAGADLERARRPAVLQAGGLRVGLLGLADHPSAYAAAADRPGIAYAPLADGVPGWLPAAIGAVHADVVVVTPHWGPNMVATPVAHVRAAARALLDAGADLVAGHSAHVFHGVQRDRRGAVLFDLGDFIDDYAVHERLRNDLGLLWLVELDADGPLLVEAVPLALDYCYTRLASADEAEWIGRRLRDACSQLGSDVTRRDGRFRIQLR